MAWCSECLTEIPSNRQSTSVLRELQLRRAAWGHQQLLLYRDKILLNKSVAAPTTFAASVRQELHNVIGGIGTENTTIIRYSYTCYIGWTHGEN